MDKILRLPILKVKAMTKRELLNYRKFYDYVMMNKEKKKPKSQKGLKRSDATRQR
jgi:hypothetical protein